MRLARYKVGETVPDRALQLYVRETAGLPILVLAGKWPWKRTIYRINFDEFRYEHPRWMIGLTFWSDSHGPAFRKPDMVRE